MLSETSPEPVAVSLIDSPFQRKRWWRRLSSARKTDSTNRGRSLSLPNNAPRRESSQEPGGWRARFVNTLRGTVRRMGQLLTN
ncbi:hypothetical protein CDAR_435571 [Caerostris darwini]|uniref:Uncharacterized protein n=1 Tax=Caerostris darwini TaxID=1538125 RepID=A0AAV4VJB9_9ARAC|nr:hypothetical protein CDAR_435571 [Caerostris darwini]